MECCHFCYFCLFFGAFAFLAAPFLLYGTVGSFTIVLVQMFMVMIFFLSVCGVARHHFIQRPVERSESIIFARMNRANEMILGITATAEEKKSERLPTYDEAMQELPSYKEVMQV
jgi:hypothetical protein